MIHNLLHYARGPEGAESWLSIGTLGKLKEIFLEWLCPLTSSFLSDVKMFSSFRSVTRSKEAMREQNWPLVQRPYVPLDV